MEVASSIFLFRLRVPDSYFFTGYDGSCFLRSVEVYTPENDQWQLIAPMNVKRSRVALAANMGMISLHCLFFKKSNEVVISLQVNFGPSEDTMENRIYPR